VWFLLSTIYRTCECEYVAVCVDAIGNLMPPRARCQRAQFTRSAGHGSPVVCCWVIHFEIQFGPRYTVSACWIGESRSE
jgi:hypothetical protein